MNNTKEIYITIPWHSICKGLIINFFPMYSLVHSDAAFNYMFESVLFRVCCSINCQLMVSI